MEDPSSQDLLLQFVLLVVLTFLNAFFSATEMAMVSLVNPLSEEIRDF